MRVRPDYDKFKRWSDEVGDDGLPVAYVSLAASPMQEMLRDFMEVAQFMLGLYDWRREYEALVEDMTPFYEEVIRVAAEGPAEVVLFGGNYDDTITYPPFFREHILPWLRRMADALHARGKLLLCHTDGENGGLLDLLRESGMDVAEPLCPAPGTRVTIGEYRRAWEGVAIWGGVPSAVVSEGCPEDEFRAYLEEMERALGRGRGS